MNKEQEIYARQQARRMEGITRVTLMKLIAIQNTSLLSISTEQIITLFREIEETGEEIHARFLDLVEGLREREEEGEETLGFCQEPGCSMPASHICTIGSCAPLSRYCLYHYGQKHLPEDERDAADRILGTPTAKEGE